MILNSYLFKNRRETVWHLPGGGMPAKIVFWGECGRIPIEISGRCTVFPIFAVGMGASHSLFSNGNRHGHFDRPAIGHHQFRAACPRPAHCGAHPARRPAGDTAAARPRRRGLALRPRARGRNCPQAGPRAEQQAGRPPAAGRRTRPAHPHLRRAGGSRGTPQPVLPDAGGYIIYIRPRHGRPRLARPATQAVGRGGLLPAAGGAPGAAPAPARAGRGARLRLPRGQDTAQPHPLGQLLRPGRHQPVVPPHAGAAPPGRLRDAARAVPHPRDEPQPALLAADGQRDRRPSQSPADGAEGVCPSPARALMRGVECVVSRTFPPFRAWREILYRMHPKPLWDFSLRSE